MKQNTKQLLFVLGEILTINGTDYCNGFAVSQDVQYLLDYKKQVLGCAHFKIGVVIGKETKMVWYGDRLETVNPVIIIATKEQ